MATLTFGSSAASSYGIFGGSGAQGAGQQHAQDFVLPGDATINSITFQAFQSGSPADNLIVKISTALDGTVLGTSAPVAASNFSVSWPGSTEVFTFTPAVSVSGGVTYYAEIERTGARSATNHLQQVVDDAGFAIDAWGRHNNEIWSKFWDGFEAFVGSLEYTLVPVLRNPQTTKEYDTTRTTRKPRTAVTATEYDDTQTTKKPRTSVTATVEGSQ